VTVISVPLAQRSYEVSIARLSADQTAEAVAQGLGKTTGVAVLVDGNVGRLSPRVQPLLDALAARLPRVKRFDLPPGESAKNLASVEHTCEWLAQQGYDRGAALVGIGGGATTDHTGFVAAIYLRGIRYATCPTTLLAMVDASVGGKTGVDIPAGKNLVGAFYQPRAVAADLGFLDSLPAREIAAGLAEVVKAGLIADAPLLDLLEAHAQASLPEPVLAQVIEAAVRMKVAVVTEDEREGGRRAILNFGHTVGHAIEAHSNFQLLHGEAVSLGMIAALALGVARGVTEPSLLDRVLALLVRLGLPTDVKRWLCPAALERMEVDKKRSADAVRFVLVSRAGQCVLEDIPLDELKRQVLAAF
jgi:3-dehydroquinate synthase